MPGRKRLGVGGAYLLKGQDTQGTEQASIIIIITGTSTHTSPYNFYKIKILFKVVFRSCHFSLGLTS